MTRIIIIVLALALSAWLGALLPEACARDLVFESPVIEAQIDEPIVEDIAIVAPVFDMPGVTEPVIKPDTHEAHEVPEPTPRMVYVGQPFGWVMVID